MGAYAIFTKRIPPRFLPSGCGYNYDKSILEYVRNGSIVALPISIYRAIDYIKNHDKKIIQF